MEFETRYKAFEIQDMKLVVIVYTEVVRISTAFGTAGKESVARRGVSDSDKVFVEAHVPPQKKFEPELVVGEKMGILLGAGLPMPMIAGRSDALEDGVVVVVSPAVDIYSAAEIEGTPASDTVAVAVDNKLDFGP